MEYTDLNDTSNNDLRSFVSETGTINKIIKNLIKCKTMKEKKTLQLDEGMKRSRSKFKTDKACCYKNDSIKKNSFINKTYRKYQTAQMPKLSVFRKYINLDSDSSEDDSYIGKIEIIDFENNELKKSFFEDSVDDFDSSFLSDEENDMDQGQFVFFCLEEIIKIQVTSKWALLNKVRLSLPNKPTLVIELDKVFIRAVRSNGNSNSSWEFEIEKRQGFDRFFAYAISIFNIIVYSSCTENVLKSILKTTRLKVDYAFPRTCCQKLQNGEEIIFIKRLDLFEQLDERNVLIIDNNPISFANNLANGVIVSEYGGKLDFELDLLVTYLEGLVRSGGCLMEENEKYMNLKGIKDSLERCK